MFKSPLKTEKFDIENNLLVNFIPDALITSSGLEVINLSTLDSTPVFNKVIDQTTQGTLDVDFVAYTDGAPTPKRGFQIKYTTNSGTNVYIWTTIEMLGAWEFDLEFA